MIARSNSLKLKILDYNIIGAEEARLKYFFYLHIIWTTFRWEVHSTILSPSETSLEFYPGFQSSRRYSGFGGNAWGGMTTFFPFPLSRNTLYHKLLRARATNQSRQYLCSKWVGKNPCLFFSSLPKIFSYTLP